MSSYDRFREVIASDPGPSLAQKFNAIEFLNMAENRYSIWLDTILEIDYKRSILEIWFPNSSWSALFFVDDEIRLVGESNRQGVNVTLEEALGFYTKAYIKELIRLGVRDR